MSGRYHDEAVALNMAKMLRQATGIAPFAIVVPVVAVAVVREVDVVAWVIVEALIAHTIVEYDVDVRAADPDGWVCVIRHVGRSR